MDDVEASRSAESVSPAVTTEELVQRVATGDHAAFAALYDRIAPQVYGVVRKVLRDPAQSEEVAQEVLLEIWRTAARYDQSKSSAATWMLTMAHRRAIDRVRTEQAARDRTERVASADVRRSVDEVAEAVEGRAESDQVRRALEGLSELQREAIKLAYYGGYTYPEVARLLDAPLGTVKTRLRDGLIRLREAMAVAQ